jgi:hypothetical protein
MASKGVKRAIMYIVALLAVSFGMEWGFSYILSAHRDRHAKRSSAPGATR